MKTVTGYPLIEALARVPDFRKSRGKRYPLAAILALAVVAVLCGYDNLTAISQWGREHGQALLEPLGFRHFPGPCVATLHRVFRQLDVVALEQVLTDWLNSCLPVKGGLALDGKTLRGSRDGPGDPMQPLAAFAQTAGLALGQQPISGKNEVAAAIELLQSLDLQEWIATGDAAFAHKAVAETILQQGGHCVLTVKKNPPTLYADIAPLFEESSVVSETITNYRQRCSPSQIGRCSHSASCLLCEIENEMTLEASRRLLISGSTHAMIVVATTKRGSWLGWWCASWPPCETGNGTIVGGHAQEVNCMSTQRSQMNGAVGELKGNGAGRTKVWWDRDLPDERPSVSWPSRARMLTLVLVCLLAIPCLAPAEAMLRSASPSAPDAPGDEYWAEGFHQSGLDSFVLALAVDQDGSLYAGGTFTAADGEVANHVARWDGHQWHAVGSGLNSWVYTLALSQDGSLYAGGEFYVAGGTEVNGIARWDGAQWHPLGSGMNLAVHALAIGPDGSIYAGGKFALAGGVDASYVARWDGRDWHPLGSGMERPYGGVYALVFGLDGSLYAGGRFDVAGGVPAANIARWDGVRWHPLGNGMNSDVNVLTVAPDGSLYAGGSFTVAGGVSANYIARWDGAQWYPLDEGVNYATRALTVAPNGSLYAGGDLSMARWDGFQWHSLEIGINPNVEALAIGRDGSLYAGGRFTSAGGSINAARIARWDGSQWHPVSDLVGNGIDGDVRVLAFGPDGSLYAGGNIRRAGGIAVSGIARWDGAEWHPLGVGINGGVFALAFGPDGSLYAGGQFTAAGGAAANSVARWDGGQWHPLGGGITGSHPAGYPTVIAMAVGLDGSLYVGGHFYSAGGIDAAYIARWDGDQWHPVGSGTFSEVYALACGPDGSIYVGGGRRGLQRWDGAQWHLVGNETDGYGVPLAFGPDGTLYAGGGHHNVARWDGAQWHPLGSGMDWSVKELAFGKDGSLYAAGWFSAAGGVAANYIAHWSGGQWHPLGSGMNYWVDALAVAPDASLYAGGYFTTAGDKASSHIALWTREALLVPTAWLPIVQIGQ